MSLYRSAASVVIARTLGMAAAFAFSVFVAWRFGSDRSTDIAFAALAVPGALMVIIGTLFPPVFTSTFKALEVGRGVDEAWSFGRSAPTVVALAGAGVAIAGVFLSPLLSRAVAGGFSPDEVGRVTLCMRLAFSLVFFVTLESALRGILNAAGSFFIPSLETCVANLVGIGVIAATAASWGEFSLVAGIVAGGVSKVLLLAPDYLRRRSGSGGPFVHPALGGMFGPVILYCLLYAVQTAIQRGLAARIEGEGPVSYLNYAEKILSVPQDLFIVSMGIVLLPSLSAKAAANDLAEVRRLVGLGLRMSFFLGLPAAVGMGILARPLVALIYQRGRFDAADTEQTALTLLGFTGAMAFSGILILYQAFYALRAPGPLLASGALIAAVNAVGGSLLVSRYRHVGLAAAFSASYLVAFAASLLLFARRAGVPDLPGLLKGVLRSALGAAVMGGVLLLLAPWPPLPVLAKVAIGAVVYLGAASFLCPEEWKLLRGGWSQRTS